MNLERLITHTKKFTTAISGVVALAALTTLALFVMEASSLRFATNEASADWYCASLTATPSTIHPGESSTIEWSFVSDEGDMSVTIMQIPGQEWQGTTGSVVVSPTVTTLYHVIAHREGEVRTVDCTTLVRVVPLAECDCDNVRLYVNEFSFTYDGPPPIEEYKVDFCDGSTTGTTTGQWGEVETFNFQREISMVTVRGQDCVLQETRSCTPPPEDPWCAMNVNPATIYGGGTTTLSWNSNNVTSVDIPGIGTGLNPADSRILSPATTTTYVGTFHGEDGTNVTCQTTVTVLPPTPGPDASCAISANPGIINQGATSTIIWDSTYVTSVDIPGIGIGLSPSGSSVVSPATTTTYTGTFHAIDSTQLICYVTVTVRPSGPTPPPTCSLNANPTTIDENGTSTITWSSANVTSVDITNIGSGLATSGTRNVSPATTTTYVGTFHGEDGTDVTCQTTVTVQPPNPNPPPTCSLSSNPATIGQNGTSTITWSSANVTSVDITNIGSGLATSGTRNVSPATTTTYVGTFHGEDGTDVTCQTTVTVSPPNPNPNPSCSMSISPSSVRAGNTATLSWSSTDVTSGSIDQGIGSVGLNGSMSVIVNQDTTYTGTFRDNQNNTVTCSARVTISRGGGSCVNCGGGGGGSDDDPNPYIVLGKTISRLGGSITLDQVPYTGFKAGPLLTAIFWASVLLASVLIAYIVTRMQPIVRTRFAVQQKEYIDTDSGSVVLQKSILSPYMNDPSILSSSNNVSDGVSEIEEVAHHENILLSPEALRIIQKDLIGSEKDTVSYLSQLFAKVKAEFPREDGWILLSKERVESILNQSVSTPIKKTDVPVTLATETNLNRPFVSGNERQNARETVGSQQERRENGATTNNVVARFIDNLVNVEKKEAFDLLRNISTQGVDVATFITLVIRQLDEVYKHRIEGSRNPEVELVKKTASWKNEDFEAVLGILVECVDYSYSNNRIGTKIALAKAFEHFTKK